MNPPPRAWGWTLLFAAAFATGIALRWFELDRQIVIDDEWHALHKLLRADWTSVLTRFGYADHSIPLTLYYKWVYQTAGLSERQMHAPALVAGIALLIAVPSLARAWTTWPTRVVWVALLAVSPLLIYHSRTARPYALTSLLTFVAIAAYWHWRRADRHRSLAAAAYVIATFTAGWMHPVTLPITLAPFVFEAGLFARAALRKKRTEGPPIGQVAALCAITVAVLAAALAPPLVIDWKQFSAKSGKDWVTPESLYRTLSMLFGTAHLPVVVAMSALAIAGIVRVARRDPMQVAYLLTLAACGIVATILSRPRWIHHPLVFARYLIPLLPFLLWFAAEGLIAALTKLRPAWRVPLATAAIVALLLQGPVVADFYHPNQFTGHLRFQFDYDHARNPYVTQIPRDPIPDFYRRLAALPPRSRTLVEAPWRLESNYNPHPWYQEVHRQRVRIGFVSGVCDERDFGEFPQDRGLPFRRFDHVAAILRGETRGADYLVLHLTPWKTPPDAKIEWPDVARCVSAAEAALGAPVYRDATLVVFPLKPERRNAL